MRKYFKNFKTFWFIELVLLVAGFYIVYDGFVADDAENSLNQTASDTSSVSGNPGETRSMSQTILETAVVCLDVDAKRQKPLMAKGRFSKYIDVLYCFTEISGTLPEELIHDWVYKDGQPVRKRVRLDGKNKVWTQMQMSPDKAGTWRVDIRTGDGQFLASAGFVLK
jgi:hypothetical protein